MGNRRFSLTTYVLVGISLVALYFVGKTVTPPPPAPPAPPSASPAAAGPRPLADKQAQAQADQHSRAEEQSARARQEKQRQMMSAAHKSSPVDSKAFNPNMIETDPRYWQQQKDGAQGAKEMRAKVVKANAGLKQPTVPTKGLSPIIPGP